MCARQRQRKIMPRVLAGRTECKRGTKATASLLRHYTSAVHPSSTVLPRRQTKKLPRCVAPNSSMALGTPRPILDSPHERLQGADLFSSNVIARLSIPRLTTASCNGMDCLASHVAAVGSTRPISAGQAILARVSRSDVILLKESLTVSVARFSGVFLPLAGTRERVIGRSERSIFAQEN
jgi:hypothetical protein